jgi:hypothetical protein
METEMQSPSSQLSHLAAPRPSPRYPPAALPSPILLCLSRARKAAPHLAARQGDRGPPACGESRHRSRATRGCPAVFSGVCAGGNGDKIPFEIPIHSPGRRHRLPGGSGSGTGAHRCRGTTHHPAHLHRDARQSVSPGPRFSHRCPLVQTRPARSGCAGDAALHPGSDQRCRRGSVCRTYPWTEHHHV